MPGEIKLLRFSDGTTVTTPVPTTPDSDDDFITRGYINTITGSTGTPETITAGGGITPTSNVWREVIFIESDGGAVDLTANPQIVAGTLVGQILILYGTSDTDYITLDHSAGLILNGSFDLRGSHIMALMWNGGNWAELYRRFSA